MPTYVDDDGSTLTTDISGNIVAVSPSPYISGGAMPGDFSASARTWSDLLRYGLSRAIDAHFNDPVRLQNTRPVVWNNGQPLTLGGNVNTPLGQVPLVALLAIAGLAIFAFKG